MVKLKKILIDTSKISKIPNNFCGAHQVKIQEIFGKILKEIYRIRSFRIDKITIFKTPKWHHCNHR